MTSSAGEDALVEQPALEWLTGAGWTHVHGRDLPGQTAGAERRAVVGCGADRAVASGGHADQPGPPGDAVQRACELAMTGTSPSLIEDHRGFHELLTAGVPIPYVDDDGIEQAERAKLIDFEHPDRNELLAVNQFTIVEGGHNRRPDILLFVNGLPLGQLELKAPGLAESAQDAINQIHHYTDTIPASTAISGSSACRPDVGTGRDVEHGCRALR